MSEKRSERDSIARSVMLLLIAKSYQSGEQDWDVDVIAKKAYAMALAMECQREKIQLEWKRQIVNHFDKNHPMRMRIEENA